MDTTTQVKQFRMFEVKYLLPTDTKGLRFKIIDTRHDKSVTINDSSFNIMSRNSWDNVDLTIREQSIKYIESCGIEVIGYSSTDDKDYIFTTDFKTQIHNTWKNHLTSNDVSNLK